MCADGRRRRRRKRGDLKELEEGRGKREKGGRKVSIVTTVLVWVWKRKVVVVVVTRRQSGEAREAEERGRKERAEENPKREERSAKLAELAEKNTGNNRVERERWERNVSERYINDGLLLYECCWVSIYRYHRWNNRGVAIGYSENEAMLNSCVSINRAFFLHISFFFFANFIHEGKKNLVPLPKGKLLVPENPKLRPYN